METGILYAVIAGLFWGTSPVLVKRGLVNSDVSAATLIQQAAILFTLILFTLLEGSVATGQISPVSMLVFIAIGIVGAYLGRTLFVKSVDQIGATRAQLVNNTSPLVTVMLAALLLGERLTVTVLAGVILIVSGIFFIPRAEAAAQSRSGQTNAHSNFDSCDNLLRACAGDEKVCDRQRWLPHARRFDHTCDGLGAVA